MISYVDNRFGVSTSPHSLGLRNNMTIPNPGWDQNPLLITEKSFWGRGMQGLRGISDDPVGWLQDEIIPGLPNWGLVLGAIGIWWMMTPHGEEYRREKRQLRQKHSGYSKVSRLLSVDEGGGRSKGRSKPATEGIF